MSKSSITNLQPQIDDMIDAHAKTVDQQLKYQYVSQCMNQCVNSYITSELALSEKKCLNSCLYKIMENHNVFKLN